MIMSYRTRDGRSCSAAEALDKDKMLRDGYAISVPYTMMDGTAVRFHDGHGNYDAIGHRPGHVISDAGDARAAVEEAYRLRDEADRNAWRGGDARKVTQRDPQGRVKSTFEEEDDEQQCDGMTLDAIEARHRRRMTAEYSAYDAQIREMWRNP